MATDGAETRSSRRAATRRHSCRQRLSIDWCIGSKIAAISPTVDRLIRVIKESQISFGDGLGVELAIREALANAIVHGNRQDPTRRVHILCRCRLLGDLFISITDEGTGFDWKQVQESAPVNVYSEHGRGIMLMKASMDRVRYRHGGSEVQMYKRGENIPNEL